MTEKPEFIAASRDLYADDMVIIEFDRPIDGNVMVAAKKEIQAYLDLHQNAFCIVSFGRFPKTGLMYARFADAIGPSTELIIVSTALEAAFPRRHGAENDPLRFKTGDIVTLKSGGFPMTVIRAGYECCGGTSIEVLWQSEDIGAKTIEKDEFPAEVLKPFRDISDRDTPF